MATVVSPELTLAEIAPGLAKCGEVLATGDDAIRLKRMGVCEGREFELVSHGDPMVLRVGGARVGVSRQLASFVLVDSSDR